MFLSVTGGALPVDEELESSPGASRRKVASSGAHVVRRVSVVPKIVRQLLLRSIPHS